MNAEKGRRLRASLVLGLLVGCAGSLKTRPAPRVHEMAAPDFDLQSHRGQRVTLRSLLDRGSVVVVFYRGHW